MAINFPPACSTTEGKLVGMSSYDRPVLIVKVFHRMYVAPTKPCSHDPDLVVLKLVKFSDSVAPWEGFLRGVCRPISDLGMLRAGETRHCIPSRAK